jgi:maleylacetoacetate isomerase/maleylpyruvate isomerase
VIIECLDETHPTPPLLPATPAERARVRALALDIACEIHPLDNLRVLRCLVRDLKLSEDHKNRWYRHWVDPGSRPSNASSRRRHRSMGETIPTR